MPKQNTTEWAAIGKVVAPFGVRGELKVFLLSDVPDRFSSLKTVYLNPGYTPHRIQTVRPYKANMVLIKFADIPDATAAEPYRNYEVCIPLDQLAELPPDSYYQHDILGIGVVTLSGRELGSVVDIMPTGSNDVYVVKSASGKQFLIPAVKEFIKRVDLSRRVMYIEPIGGMVDDDAVIDDPDTLSSDTDE